MLKNDVRFGKYLKLGVHEDSLKITIGSTGYSGLVDLGKPRLPLAAIRITDGEAGPEYKYLITVKVCFFPVAGWCNGNEKTFVVLRLRHTYCNII